MTTTTTMSIRLTPDLKEKLGVLADSTRRSRSYLAAEAVQAYVTRELQIIDGINRGVADIEAGRVLSHDEAMDQLDDVARAAKADKPRAGQARNS